MANIPPAKRECVFKVFDLFCPMCRTVDEKSIPIKNRQLIPGDTSQGQMPIDELETVEGGFKVIKAEEWRETVENFRPAAEEAAIRDEEAAQFLKFGGPGPGFMSV